MTSIVGQQWLAVLAAAIAMSATCSSATEFGITGLSTTGSNTVEISPVTGGDRGGIALSPSQVFYTGETSTGRFALADLTGGTAVGAVRDFLLSDLSTGQVYVLGDGMTPLSASSSSGTATTLLEVDGATGALTGASSTLSSPIHLEVSVAGIFSGWQRAVVAVPPSSESPYPDGAFFNVDLPSGTVTLVGGLAMMQKLIFALSPNLCPSGGFWGVAEQLGTELWVAFAHGDTVVRLRAPDGLDDVVATFSDITNICSFTVSPSNDRWYFEYPGTTQFGSGTQTLGYADATWSNAFPDADGDGTTDAYDNCPTANPGQADCDDDGVGDACDPDTIDPDGDLIDEPCDNCPATANTDQQNSDGDPFGDACDACFGPGPDDTDLDGDCDGFDNCPTIANPGQEDGNGDGVGEACSPQVTISSITSNGDDLTANVTATSPVGLTLSGLVSVCDGTDVTDLTFTFLFTGCDLINLEFTINGTVVESIGGPVQCFPLDCTPGIGTVSVPLTLLTPGVNRLGVRKEVTPFGLTLLAWAYATVTTSSGTHRVELFDSGGGDDYDNPDLCAAGYTAGPVDTQASTPFLCDTVASQSWSGTLPNCGLDISGLADQSYTLVVSATDGVVGVPSKDFDTFTHAGEADLFINTSCGDANPCTVDCDVGGGNCSHTPASLGTVCRAAAGGCDVAEICDGVSSICPSDATQPDGASCADGQFCNGAEQCLGGACQPAADPCPLGCDEGTDQCVSACPPMPQSGCKTAGKSILIVKNNGDDDKDKLLWKWLKGQPTMLADFGDPQTSADYVLCLYGGASETPLADGEVDVPRSASKWTPLGTTGWKYDDPAATADGAQKLRLKSSTEDRSKALLKGKGMALPDLMLPVAGPNFPLLVQLLNSQTATCLESSFASDDVVKNEDDQFKAKSP